MSTGLQSGERGLSCKREMCAAYGLFGVGGVEVKGGRF